MDTALYVNTVGALVNDSTKHTVDIDEVSVTNIVLIDHLQKVLDTFEIVYPTFLIGFREKYSVQDIRTRLGQYLNCLKKEINFYESKATSEDCILTELDGNIKLEL